MTFADKVIAYSVNLHYTGKSLPHGIRVMNPFKESTHVMDVVRAFYRRYYNDNRKRHLILGINPGRLGAGTTGIPFTDTKRLVGECGISYSGPSTHELSSVFIYEMINAYGGPEQFYRDFFISSPCPLGFTSKSTSGKEINYNYYDSKALLNAVEDYILDNIRTLIALGVITDVCCVFGTGKNYNYLQKLNEQHQFFGRLLPLEHPRYIMQYKSKQKEHYIQKYLSAFASVKA